MNNELYRRWRVLVARAMQDELRSIIASYKR